MARNQVAEAFLVTPLTGAVASIYRFRAPVTGTITRVKIWTGDTMSGGTAIFDVNKNGTTIFTDQSGRPIIPEDGDNAQRTSFDVSSITKDDIITVDFDGFTGSETSTGTVEIVIEMTETGATLNDAALYGADFGVELYRSTAQTITTDTPTAISFLNEARDNGPYHSTSSNQTRVVVPANADGWYTLQMMVEFANSANTVRQRLGYAINGGTVVWVENKLGLGGSYVANLCGGACIWLDVADYVEMFVEHDQGSDLDANPDNTRMSLVPAGRF